MVISAIGTFIMDGDDVLSTPITLLGPNPFKFNGVGLTDIEMSLNGFLITDIVSSATTSDFSNGCPLPATPGGGVRI